MVGIIACASANGVIGVDNKLPFSYPEDLQHFRQKTSNSVVVMGRKTYESIGKPLPKRKNIVVSSTVVNHPDVITTKSVEEAQSLALDELKNSDQYTNIWYIGGAQIYREAMKFADEIWLTITKDWINSPNAVYFPLVNPVEFYVQKWCSDTFKAEAGLELAVFARG